MDTCPHCGTAVTPDNIFCPHCGKELKPSQPSVTLFSQLTSYLISIFLPPFGLWPAFRYLKQTDPKARRAGIICIVLTVLSLLTTVLLTTYYVQRFNQVMNQELNQYQDLGL